MRLTILLALVGLGLGLFWPRDVRGQESPPWNPDANGDGCVTTSDLVSLLSVFGLCSDWGSVDCPDSLEFTCSDPLDFDNYAYQTVLIGSQCWFAENLRTTVYANGELIPAGLTDGEWTSTTSGATAVYGEGSSTCNNYSPDIDACDEAQSLEAYGRLYNWYAVDDARGLCPDGWHVPTDGEWQQLELELGMTEAQANSTGWRGTDQATQLKTTYGWYNGGNGTNSSGFSDMPVGYRSSNGFFDTAGFYSYSWSSSPDGFTAWYRNLYSDLSSVYRGAGNLRSGFSVRCLRDAE
ncbi:MAG: fibrobacter succinogenes major paralogous domain-containing protein [Flavobacteriales bacterium]